ncbi:MAG: cytochrome c biogenesis protein CcsA [Halioglobus sp.]
MSASILAPIAALLYLAATGLHLMHIFQQRQDLSRGVAVMGGLAMLCHSIVAVQGVSASGGLSLGFYKISALMFLAINVVCALLMLRRPLQNLLVVLFPLSAMSVLVSTFAPETTSITTDLPGGMLLHIGSSILAYAVLTLAAAQSALVAAQDYQLHNRHTRGIVQILPPLQLMEVMLFELLLVGVVLLTLSIISGFLFVDDIFAQSLVHKTILTIVAWLLFSVLLWGHHKLGWRSQIAVRLTLAGFAALMLAFFGSKLVLELVLQRG